MIQAWVIKKIASLFVAKRFYAAILSALLMGFGEQFGVDQSIATEMGKVLIGWIVGDTIRPTANVFRSKRFHLVLATIALQFLSGRGLAIDPSAWEAVTLPIISLVIGDAYREMKTGDEKVSQYQTRT